MSNKIKLLSNIFLAIGIIFGIITLFQISNLDLLNLNFHWICFIFLSFLTIIFLLLGISFKCLYKELNDEIQAIYRYHGNKIKDIDLDK